MSNIGFWEMMVLAGIALVVMGPEKFPEFAKMAMRTYRDFRGYLDNMKRDLTSELRPVETELRKAGRFSPETYIDALAKVTEKATQDESKPEPVPPATTSGAPIPPVDPAAPIEPVTYMEPNAPVEPVAPASSPTPPSFPEAPAKPERTVDYPD